MIGVNGGGSEGVVVDCCCPSRHVIVFLDHCLSDRQINLVKKQFLASCSSHEFLPCPDAGRQMEVLLLQFDSDPHGNPHTTTTTTNNNNSNNENMKNVKQNQHHHYYYEVVVLYRCQTRDGGFITAWHQTAGGTSIISRLPLSFPRQPKQDHHHPHDGDHRSIVPFFITGSHVESGDVVYAVYCAHVPTLSLARGGGVGGLSGSCSDRVVVDGDNDGDEDREGGGRGERGGLSCSTTTTRTTSSITTPLLFSIASLDIHRILPPPLPAPSAAAAKTNHDDPAGVKEHEHHVDPFHPSGSHHHQHHLHHHCGGGGVQENAEAETEAAAAWMEEMLIRSFFAGEERRRAHCRGGGAGRGRRRSGKFIVVDGADGAGKETQTERLRRRLVMEKEKEALEEDERVREGQGGAVVAPSGWMKGVAVSLSSAVGRIAFPHYGGFCGNVVRDVLSERKGPVKQLSTLSLSLMFTLNRLSKRAELLWSKYQGRYVLLDRYYTANFGYQGAKVPDEERESFVRYLERIEVEWLGLPRPDMVVYLDLPPQTALLAMQQDTKRRELDANETASMDVKEKIRQVFCWCCMTFDNWRQVLSIKPENGERYSIEEVHEKLWLHVHPILTATIG